MKSEKILSILIFIILGFSLIASGVGIFSNEGEGNYEYKTIHGEKIVIYGKGIYKDMSADVAPQGIAQDYVTFFIAAPLLLISFYRYRKGSVKAQFLLSGIVAYILVTYLLYIAMAMYNALFLVYVMILGSSLFAFLILFGSFNPKEIKESFSPSAPIKFSGYFLMVGASIIALLWLGIIIPPLLNGTIIPKEVQHYTTLIVQGFDLAMFLPLGFVSGFLLVKRIPLGYVVAPIYTIFLSVLMTALLAKIIYMGLLGYNIIPVIFIIPLFDLIAIISAYRLIK